MSNEYENQAPELEVKLICKDDKILMVRLKINIQ